MKTIQMKTWDRTLYIDDHIAHKFNETNTISKEILEVVPHKLSLNKCSIQEPKERLGRSS